MFSITQYAVAEVKRVMRAAGLKNPVLWISLDDNQKALKEIFVCEREEHRSDFVFEFGGLVIKVSGSEESVMGKELRFEHRQDVQDAGGNMKGGFFFHDTFRTVQQRMNKKKGADS